MAMVKIQILPSTGSIAMIHRLLSSPRSSSLVWQGQRRFRWRFLRLPLVVMVLGCLTIGSQAWAEGNLRNSFPGRRVGGGTRGECTARLVANLVPQSNVYAPGSSGLIAILQGPSANLHPLVVAFKAANASGVVEPGTALLEKREIAAAPAGLVLLHVPSFKGNVQWESSYRCEGVGVDPDPLNFVSAGAPPALSLLVTTADAGDRSVQSQLLQLKGHCGASVGREQIAKAFALDDLLANGWPAQLPVVCQ
jgi:hypothetical protein